MGYDHWKTTNPADEELGEMDQMAYRRFDADNTRTSFEQFENEMEAEIEKLINKIEKLSDTIEKLSATLEECEEYFDNRADCDCDQDGYIPNEEMKMLMTVREALNGSEWY